MTQAEAKNTYLQGKELAAGWGQYKKNPRLVLGCLKYIVLLDAAVTATGFSCAAAIVEGGINVPADAACALSVLGIVDASVNVRKTCRIPPRAERRPGGGD